MTRWNAGSLGCGRGGIEPGCGRRAGRGWVRQRALWRAAPCTPHRGDRGWDAAEVTDMCMLRIGIRRAVPATEEGPR